MKFLTDNYEHKKFIDGVSFDNIRDGWKDTYECRILSGVGDNNLASMLTINNDENKVSENLFVKVQASIDGRWFESPIQSFKNWSENPIELGEFPDNTIADVYLNFSYVDPLNEKVGSVSNFDFEFGTYETRQ